MFKDLSAHFCRYLLNLRILWPTYKPRNGAGRVQVSVDTRVRLGLATGLRLGCVTIKMFSDAVYVSERAFWA